ncbi:MAG: CHAT domain-containing protein, partial [Bacteroidota bacterium]|nr:CHAT domain-containing protein [Bacteroidota bacterium]
PYLPFSEREADDINVQLSRQGYSVNLYSGLAGTEIMLKEEGSLAPDHVSPSILHISTHGFFFPQPDASISDSRLSEDYVFKLSNHSMLRSGLLFSGVNPYWLQTKESTYSNEGILTAYEISQLKLDHTNLVVLSACETGLGDIKGFEGVFGLQRAFKIAGANQVITSLWQIPDFQTYELMDLFYKGYLEQKLSARQALKFAQDKMRQKRYEPFYWAGFVLME